MSDAGVRANAFLSAILGGVADMIWAVDAERFGLLWFGRGLTEYFRAKRELTIAPGMRPEELFTSSEYITLWHEFYQRALRDGPFSTEYVVSTGTNVLELSFDLLTEGGVVFGILVVGRDVTATKRAEKFADEWERTFRGMFELSPDPLAITVAADGTFVDVNQAYTTWSGHTREELIGKTSVEAGFWSEDQRGRILAPVHGGAETCDVRLRLRIKSGELRDVFLWSKPLTVGGVAHVYNRIRDITDQVRAEEARSQAQRTRDLLLHASGVNFILTDPNGIVREYLVCDEESHAVYAAVVGRDIVDLYVIAEDRDYVRGVFRACAETPRCSTIFRYRIRDAMGTLRHRQATITNLLDEESVGALVIAARDITSETLLQEQLVQAQKLESIGQLAGGVAHDFNNLLGVILGFGSDLLANQGGSREADADDIQAILNAAEQGKELTQQLLAFARKQVVSPVVLDLNQLVRSCQKMLQRLLGANIELASELSPALWRIRCDKSQIEQILLNLAANARDAMGGGGKFTIATANVEVGSHLHEGEVATSQWVRLSVFDTGAGMAPEVKAHLFEPFFTTKPPGHGTGLGLATVHGIVNQNAGHIRVTSELGCGSRFEILLPRVIEGETELAPPRAASKKAIGAVQVRDAGFRRR
jgi:PAS domain S-box-containing protein